MNVSIIGTGYVGLVSGVCLAEMGHQVTCVDVDREKVDSINRGIAPIYEKGLNKLLKKHVNKNFCATLDLEHAVKNTQISLIAVGTPYDGEKIDLRFIEDVSKRLGQEIQKKEQFHTIIVKSTVVPGTTDKVVKAILEEYSGKKAGTDFGVGMNPEFLREGEAIIDFLNPDRIVLGASDAGALEALEMLYEPFHDVDKIRTNTQSAEMIKYTSNSLLATLISFSNEIANLCDKLGDIDAKDVMHGVHMDKRLSPILKSGERVIPSITTYLEAGCGFGGSCFPKDVKALISHGKNNGNPMQILEAVIDVNKNQPMRMIRKLKKRIKNIENISVGILGLAFKPGTDDVRESPAIRIIKELREHGVKIKAFDPIAADAAKKIIGEANVTYCGTLEETIDNVDAILLVTRWEEFKALPQLLSQIDPQPVLIDGRRMVEHNAVDHYDGIGLGRV